MTSGYFLMNLNAWARVPMTKMPTAMAIHLELLDSGVSLSYLPDAGVASGGAVVRGEVSSAAVIGGLPTSVRRAATAAGVMDAAELPKELRT